LHQKSTKQNKPALLWVPSLYFAEGLPYVVVMSVSVILYKNMGVSNTDLALYTGWLYLPWMIKPIWSPVVDLLKTNRWWIVAMQLFIGASLGMVALSLHLQDFLFYSLLFFWLMAFSSATHDIAADGFYMQGLDAPKQAAFVGVRSLFYRLAMIFGQGAVVVAAGHLSKITGDTAFAWSLIFWVMAALFILFAVYHWLFLPRTQADELLHDKGNWLNGIAQTFVTFFAKPGVGVALLFFLLFRLGESQLAKMASPFLLDDRAVGGLGLTTEQVGIIYGTAGVIFLILGGILGGLAIYAKGLKYWIWWMTLAINLPDVLYVLMAHFQPENLYLVGSLVAAEQFGYGFGFAAFMMFMMHFADGPHKTAHYAWATAFMAAGMMLPGMASGWLQSLMGYQWFFVWVCLCTLPGFVLIKYLAIDANVGRKKTE
jgi:MFS transporter, PAT family, beta-lactamase induction signal transducer AmpG